ncbi:glycosyltransferase [Marinomonas rhizomae]|uniref:Glycosyltransferase involved in cell wall biosynthesis n=1 Tax=Marinomonas rhizomae TaxID=491948 RepID=A0A366J8K0_9GAMM|nr:glycosyltransferase [Marinomonas rhizomae]RBP83272.1 glycosyltransferase involved in cell wall biosynthesis [Marinomonas rhizomae]RNF69390.1 glycosyltransferase [Marinomonas rhizomae]
MKNKIIIVGGLVDFQKSGNQSIKQTVKGFLEEYDVCFLSALPKNKKGLDKEFLKNHSDLTVYRLPRFLGFFFFLFGRIYKANRKKNKAGVKTISSELPQFEETVDYFDTVSSESMKKYRFFQLIYVLFESIRLIVLCSLRRPLFLYGVETYGGLAASVVGRLLGIQVIKRFQGTPLVVTNQGIHNQESLYSFISVYKKNKERDLVVMANDGTKGDQVLSFLGIDISRTFFPVNGFTMENLNHVHTKSLGPGKHVVMLSKLKVWKRVDRGLRALASLLELDNDITLHIIGDGEMREQLISLASKLNIESKVNFYGAISNKNALELLASCDLFWSFYDITNLGNPILEAAYFERPIQTLYESSMAKLVPKECMYSLDDFDTIVSDAFMILNDDKKRLCHIESSKNLKSKIITWPERMSEEIQWIKSKIVIKEI